MAAMKTKVKLHREFSNQTHFIHTMIMYKKKNEHSEDSNLGPLGYEPNALPLRHRVIHVETYSK